MNNIIYRSHCVPSLYGNILLHKTDKSDLKQVKYVLRSLILRSAEIGFKHPLRLCTEIMCFTL